jgi:hypothetical protein
VVTKRLILPLVVIALITSVNFIAADFADNESNKIAVDQSKDIISIPKQAPVYRPVFWKADANTTELVERYPINNTGAVVKADLYSNVTIWYTYVGGDNESAPLLFGDDGTTGPTSLSWTEGTLMTYDNETTVTKNDGLGYYNYTFNMSSQFVTFRARYGLYEDDIGVPNIITTGLWLNSSFIQDFYTQYDQIDMNIKMRKYNITNYGLVYREVITDPVDPDYTTNFVNVTIPFIEDGSTISKTVNATTVDTFPVDTELDVRAFVTHYDNVTMQERIFFENDADIVTIADGNPQMNVTHTRYTNSLNVSVYWEAAAPKLNITSVEIDWDDATGIDVYSDLPKHTAYHLYAAAAEYEITLTAYAYGASISEEVTILIDTELPEGEILVRLQNGTFVNPLMVETQDIETEDRRITLFVNGSDTGGSDMQKLVIETDEGNLYEYLNADEVTISFLEYGMHEVYFRVYDNSDNFVEYSFSINLTEPPEPTMGPVPYPFGVISLLGLVAIAIIYLRKKR